MKIAVIVFIIVASGLALATLIYVAVDVILEKRKKQTPVPMPVSEPVPVPEPEPEPEPVPVSEPEPVPVPEPVVLPDPIEEIDAETADEMLSNEVAMAAALIETGAGVGYRTYINIGTVSEHFAAGDTVTLAALKAKGLVEKKAQRIKILADGYLDKPLTVTAESFSVQAIKMIELTGGTVIILK